MQALDRVSFFIIMAVDKLKYAIGNAASTTLSTSISNSATSAPLTSDTNFSAKSGEGMVIIDEGTASEEFAYATTKSGSSLTIPLANRGLEGGSAQAHDTGVSVKGILTSGMWNDLIDALVDNLLDKTAGTTKTGIALTSPKVTTGINDANNNELFKVTATSSAVNEITVANAATGNNPTLSMTGGDSNVGLNVKMKGTAYFVKPTVVHIPAFGPATDTATGDGKAMFEVPEELNGMNITAVGAYVYTAGTTNVTTFQLRNVTDSVDICSTAVTIDSAEKSSRTAATPAVIDTSKDDLATGDLLAIDCDSVSSTPAKGATFWFRAELAP